MSEVYFADLRADLGSAFSPEGRVAVKTHFGEEGTTFYLRPELMSRVVDMGGTSTDIADLVNAAPGLRDSMLRGGLAPGNDKFKETVNTDWTAQLRYAEELGLGERSYEQMQVR